MYIHTSRYCPLPQILLNFFVAVILDNLDYDEEWKKEKLQRVYSSKITRKVPRHLELFKNCGPQLISPPKIAAAGGGEVPHLTEADVKSFYETGEARDLKEAFPAPAFPSQSMGSGGGGTLQRQSSDLSQLSLISQDPAMVSSASSYQNRFHGERGGGGGGGCRDGLCQFLIV